MNDLIFRNQWFFWLSSVSLIFNSYLWEFNNGYGQHFVIEELRKNKVKMMEVRITRPYMSKVETYYYDKDGDLTAHIIQFTKGATLRVEHRFEYDERKFPVLEKSIEDIDSLPKYNTYTWDYSHPDYIEGKMTGTRSEFVDSYERIKKYTVDTNNYFRFYLDSAKHITRFFATKYHYDGRWSDDDVNNGILDENYLDSSITYNKTRSGRRNRWTDETIDEELAYNEKQKLIKFISNKAWKANTYFSYNEQGEIAEVVGVYFGFTSDTTDADSINNRSLRFYDKKNRLISKVYYDNDTTTIKYKYNKEGKCITAKGNRSTEKMSYYSNGLIKSWYFGSKRKVRKSGRIDSEETREYRYTYY